MPYTIGLMSGTSMDGIDAVVFDVNTHTCVASLIYPYPPQTKKFLQQVLDETNHSFYAINKLSTLLGQAFGDAANAVLIASSLRPNEILAIGSHGQTVCHDTSGEYPFTVQLGCPHQIADKTGITVVADFRTRDIVAGGQGAPFAPLYHRELFVAKNHPIAVVNIGGISNVTFVNGHEVLGFDTGPGNALMDMWAKEHWQRDYDKNGAIASSGQVNIALLENLLQDPYFSKRYPKSLGKEYFSKQWLENKFKLQIPKEDVMATLSAFTAKTISESIKNTQLPFGEILICGGGVHNPNLLNAIKAEFPEHEVNSTEKYGIHPDYIEAMLFAWLAYQTMSGHALSLEAITGSSKPVKLGVIYPV